MPHSPRCYCCVLVVLDADRLTPRSVDAKVGAARTAE